MEAGYWIGWLGVAFGLFVPIPQLLKIIRTHSISGVSRGTYIFLCLALTCYLVHAIYIHSLIFTIAQSINLTTNTVILILLYRR